VEGGQAVRISRPCYDKFHRCPGWIGGGPRYPRHDSRCDGGRIQVDYDAPLWRFRTWRCNTCDVVVLPYATRWLSVPWLLAETRCWLRDLPYRWRHR
jgi:hypothetical protein